MQNEVNCNSQIMSYFHSWFVAGLSLILLSDSSFYSHSSLLSSLAYIDTYPFVGVRQANIFSYFIAIKFSLVAE